MYQTISSLGGGITLENISFEENKETLSKEVACAWNGCKSQYTGVLPLGWRKIMVFKNEENPKEVNGSLCPTHVNELGKFLKAGYKLAVAAAESQTATD